MSCLKTDIVGPTLSAIKTINQSNIITMITMMFENNKLVVTNQEIVESYNIEIEKAWLGYVKLKLHDLHQLV
jgi:hypothetical protein